MRLQQPSLSSLIRLLALVSLALGGCAAPTAVPPTAVRTQPATATPLPPTAAATPQSTAAPLNIPVPATSVTLGGPIDSAFDGDCNLYVSDALGYSIDKIDSFGLLTVYAGTGANGFSGDGGPARSAELDCPAGLAFDRAGNLYVADLCNNRIRRIDRNGIISTAAGSGPANGDPGGFAGDGGTATSALLNSPTDIAFDASGNLYLADANNYRIRKVDKQGVITTVPALGPPASPGMAARRRPPNSARPRLRAQATRGLRLMPRGTSTSPTVATAVSARLIIRGSLRRLPAAAGSTSPETAARRRPPYCPGRMAWPSMPAATCILPRAIVLLSSMIESARSISTASSRPS